MPSQSPTLNGGGWGGVGWGGICDSRYRFFAVSLKKGLSGDNYRRLSQLLFTRIVAHSYKATKAVEKKGWKKF